MEICVPIYNEEQIMAANIRRLLEYVRKQSWTDWQIVLLVNGSSDASETIARKIANDNPREIKTVVTPSPGKGRAIINYFKSSGADILIYLDVDLAVSLEDLPALIQSIKDEGYDLAFGSRLIKGAKTDRQLVRELSSRLYNWLSRKLLNHSFQDLQCGFKAMKKELFQTIGPQIQNQNWFFDTELIVLALRAGYRLKEIPVDWQEARYEQRKSRIKIFRDAWAFIKNLIQFHRRLKSSEQGKKPF